MNFTALLRSTLSRLLLILTIPLIMASCRKEVNWEFPIHKPVPTIIGLVEAGNPISIHVSLSGCIDTTQLNVVTNAQVRLFEDGQYIETLEYENDGFYTSSLLALGGKEYQCETSIEGYELVTASTIVPHEAPIGDVKYIKDTWFNYWGDLQNTVELTFNRNDASYLEVIVWRESGNRVNHAEINDPVLLNEGLSLTLFSTESVPTDTYTMNINLQIEGNTQIIVELRSVCKHYYNYTKQLSLYQNALYPDYFSGVVPAFPLYSNVKGGYGIFAGYAKAISDTISPIERVKMLMRKQKTNQYQ